MAETIDPELYIPEVDDIYILEVKAGRFTVHRYYEWDWEQLGASFSEQEITTLTAPMRFLFETKGFRRYYRPTEDEEQEPPEMYLCTYCGQYHPITTKEWFCPLDPNKSQQELPTN